MTIVYFVLILGVTVFIHELGHFMFAKKFGVHVYEFSLGMGPRLFKFNRKNDETDYCIRLFPIGGFVQMAGEEIDEDESIPEDKRLNNKPAFQRFMIMVAGVMMNFLLSIVLLFFVGLFSKISLDNVYINGSTIKGLNDGDKIVAINSHFVNNYDKLALEMTIVGDKDFTMTVKDSKGKKNEVDVTPIKVGKSNLLYGKDYGFSISDLTVLESSLKGLSKGDKILSINGNKVSSYLDLLNKLDEIDEDKFKMEVESENGKKNLVNVGVSDKTDDESLGYSYGFYIKGKESKGFFAAVKYAFTKFFSTIEQMIFTVFYLITGKISLSMLSGPVGIFNVVSIYSKYGFKNIISLLCLICINVGFINLLPLPAFDGGHVLFIIIEKIKGSKVDPKVENTIHSIGFILLMILMVAITYSDIVKLF
mgnify:FL=1